MAIAAYAATICIGVTDSPWPNGRLYIEVPEYFEGGRMIPPSSPGRSTPVGDPKPNRCTQSLNCVGPSRAPISSAPMLLETFRIPAVVSVS